jgi:4-amino-4-deoxy-L-arabinose transferase-like glycosyltransferase
MNHLGLAVVLALSVPLIFVGLGLPLLDPDEGLYADIAWRMLTDGDWVVPRFNGFPYLEKPPLYFWVAGLALALTGPSEWALRLGSALPAVGSVVLVWGVGRALYGSLAGVLGGVALASTAGYALYVRKASTDFLFVFCLALALYGFVRDAERPALGWRRFLLLYLGMALGVLAKGLMGVVFPALIVGIGLAWVRRLSVRDLNWHRGAVLFGLVALPWHVLVAWRHPELFWFYLVDNQLLRFLNLRLFIDYDVPVSTLGLLVASFLWVFPWSVFVLARPAADPAPAAPWRPLLPIWIAVVLLFFAASRSKLEYYLLPAFPPVAALVGAAWAGGRDIGRWLWVGLAGCLGVGGWALWTGARLTPDQAYYAFAELNVYYRILRGWGQEFPFASARPFGVLLMALGGALVFAWSLAAACWALGRRRAAFVAIFGLGVFIEVLILQMLYVVEPHHSAKAVSLAVMARARPDDVIVVEGPLELSAGLLFYTGRRIVVVNGTRGDQDFASRQPDARGYFLDTQRFEEAWKLGPRVFLVTQQPPGRSLAKSLSPDSLHLLGRFGSRWLYSNRDS